MRPGGALCEREPPLRGYAVGVTADRRSRELAELLARYGAEVTHGPVLRSMAVDDNLLRDATTAVIDAPPDVLVVTTGIGMRSWVSAAQAWGIDDRLLAALRDTRIWVRAPKASAAVQQAGLTVWREEPSERLDALIETLTTGDLRGLHLALLHCGQAPPHHAGRLRQAGSTVTEISSYCLGPIDDEGPAQRLAGDIVEGRMDAVTFTSPPSVEHLVALAARGGTDERLRHAFETTVLAACVGPTTAAAATSAGIRVGFAPEQGRLGLMVRGIADLLSSRHRHLHYAGCSAVIRGRSVVGQWDSVMLSERERSLLDALAHCPGAVVSTTTLLRSVWQGDHCDPHVVETAIARLRPRLKPVGLTVVTRPRRGYLLDAEERPCPRLLDGDTDSRR